MKLSIEEKAKAYDQAIERAKIFKKHLIEIEEKDYADEMDYIFPELKESEDERIRKGLIAIITDFESLYLQENYSLSREEALDWLKKKGEQKEVEPTPIFRIGDILKRKGKDYTFRVDRVQGGYYHCDRNHGAVFPIEEQDNWELVEQKSAEWNKNDEVLLDETLHFIREFQQSDRCIDEGDMQNSVACEKWLNSLKDRVQPQPKQEWSEEDEKMLNQTLKTACAYGTTKMIDWLKTRFKSLRPHNNWKPSDEQMELIKDIVFKDRQKITRKELTIFHSIYNDLKKLREE